MPWKVVKDGDTWKVKNTETHKIEGRHGTKKAAQEHKRALYANVDEAKR